MNKAAEPPPQTPFREGNELTSCLQKAVGLWGLLEWHNRIIIYFTLCCAAGQGRAPPRATTPPPPYPQVI